MKKIIICDFNRTIYNPDSKNLFYGVRITLTHLKNRGYYLILLTQVRKKSRIRIVRSFNLSRYFDEIKLVPLKSMMEFRKLCSGVDVSKSFSVGDYIEQDIAYAKRCGFTTIRIKAGKFKDQEPKNKFERADFEVVRFTEIVKIISK